MSANELTDGCFSARKKFNTANSIMRRMFDVRANFRTPQRAGIYLAANLLSRREILRKQGRRLGSSECAVMQQEPTS